MVVPILFFCGQDNLLGGQFWAMGRLNLLGGQNNLLGVNPVNLFFISLLVFFFFFFNVVFWMFCIFFLFRDRQLSDLIGLPGFSSIFCFFVIFMLLDVCIHLLWKQRLIDWLIDWLIDSFIHIRTSKISDTYTCFVLPMIHIKISTNIETGIWLKWLVPVISSSSSRGTTFGGIIVVSSRNNRKVKREPKSIKNFTYLQK